ncbi:MAG: serpin family protein, partial [Clostridia bacterium]|nr:serpin family protein [Clostridia bacterium]
VALKEGTMQFILPEEGVTPYDILMDSERMARIFAGTDAKDNIYGRIDFSVPKFEYSDKLDLIDTLSDLGVTDAFSRENADFSPASDWSPLFVSRVRQETNISIDEKGVEAAAFTEIAYAGAAMPKDYGEIILDRPFIYIIYSRYQIPMFIGVVNDPTA